MASATTNNLTRKMGSNLALTTTNNHTLMMGSNFASIAKNNVAFYWGQDSTGSEQSLGYYCQQDVGDIFIIGFLDGF